MTNLSSDRPKWRQRFSRERVLIGVPVVTGLVAALALAVIDGKPRLERLSVQTDRLEELRRKQAALPGLIEQLKEFSALYGRRNVACAFTGRLC